MAASPMSPSVAGDGTSVAAGDVAGRVHVIDILIDEAALLARL